VVADPASNPNLAAQDALLDARYPGEPRYAVLPDPDDFATLDLDGVERVWTSRFRNSAGWVFVLSGDLDVDTAIDLASAYVGTLPMGVDETWVDVEDPPPTGVSEVSIQAGTGDTASLTMLFSNPVAAVDERLRVAADIATEVVAARLTDVVREELGESYSPLATIRVTTDPDPVVETRISVTGAPGRIDQLAALVVGELDQLVTAGPGPQEYVNAFAQVRETYNFVNNGDFITELLNDAIHPALDIDDYLLEFAALDGVDARTVTEFLATNVRTDRFIQVTVLPR
jgi:zinc protease